MAELDIILNVEPIRRVASSTLSGTYSTVGTPLTNASRSLIMCNNTTQLVTISFDGINDHIDFVAGATLILDIAALKQLTNACWRAQGTQFWAKGTAGTGNFCITSFY